MTNSDISEGDVNSQPLIEHWLELGFTPSTFDDVESLSPSEFETLQTTLHSAVELIQRLEPFIISEEIQQMREEVNDIKNYSDVQERFQQWLSINAPWEPGYHRCYQQWSGDEETKSHYWHIIAICAEFDESSWASLIYCNHSFLNLKIIRTSSMNLNNLSRMNNVSGRCWKKQCSS